MVSCYTGSAQQMFEDRFGNEFWFYYDCFKHIDDPNYSVPGDFDEFRGETKQRLLKGLELALTIPENDQIIGHEFIGYILEKARELDWTNFYAVEQLYLSVTQAIDQMKYFSIYHSRTE